MIGSEQSAKAPGLGDDLSGSFVRIWFCYYSLECQYVICMTLADLHTIDCLQQYGNELKKQCNIQGDSVF